MKIRNGFISNSSSASFLIIAQSHIPDSIELRLSYLSKSYHYLANGKKIHDYEQDLYKYIEEPEILVDNPSKPEYNYQRLSITFPAEISYCRGDVMELTTVNSKIKYCMALYSYWYSNSKEYFLKVLDMNSKLKNLCLKYKYILDIRIIPLHAHYKVEWDNNFKKLVKTDELETDVNVSTECCYVGDLVRVMEDEDTIKLEEFLFNPYSFAILGGDEYEETYRLAYEARQKVDYPYDFIGDYTEHSAEDLDSSGESYGYSEYWGDIIPDYWDADHIPEENWWAEQPTLPWENEN